MPDKQIAALKLQFARQLYDKCLEQHGKNHEQTRIVLHYISTLENRESLARNEDGLPSANDGLPHGTPAFLPVLRSC